MSEAILHLFPRLAFYPSLLYNIVLEKLAVHQWYNRIDDHVILGALPFRGMTKQLIEEENVKGVITMNEEFETKYFVNNQEEWEKSGIAQLRLDTADFVGSPSLKKIEKGMQFIDHIKQQNGTVYIHCKAGRTRSTTIVACYLMQQKKISPPEAVDLIRQKRPHIILHKQQLDSLNNFHHIINQQETDKT